MDGLWQYAHEKLAVVPPTVGKDRFRQYSDYKMGLLDVYQADCYGGITLIRFPRLQARLR